jgi:hypothetical protein
MKQFLILLILTILAASCSSVKPPFDPDAFKKNLYRRDMTITADGYQGHGFIVLPKKDKYTLEIKAQGKLDLLTFTSCHREITQTDAGYKGRFLGFGKDLKLAKMEYEPMKGIEDTGSCPIEIGGYEKEKGRHSWASVLMEHLGSTLPSVTKCNGRESQYRGVSACQSRAGLIQRIEFQVPVVYDLDKNCSYKNVRLIDGKILEYQMPEGECLVYFMEKTGEKRISEHYDYGYSKIMIGE